MRKMKRTGVILCVILIIFGMLTLGLSAADAAPTHLWQNLSSFFFGFDISDIGSIVRAEIPIIGVVNSSNMVLAARGEAIPAAAFAIATTFEGDGYAQDINIYPRELGEDEFPIMELNAAPAGGIFINNETNFDIIIDDFLNRPLSFDFSVSEPKILIIHTHTTEAFTPPDVMWYHISNNKRSHDPTQNVVRVGEEFLRVFRENGIQAVHATAVHDYPSFSGSYQAALATIQQYKQRYPSIQLVLDVHRDAIIRECGTKIKLVNEIEGQTAAQIMFVVGTNAGGLQHEYWRDNLALVIQMQDRILSNHPSLARPINLRRERFNQHATPGSMLIEIGTSGNTLDEALLAARYTALSMVELFKDM